MTFDLLKKKIQAEIEVTNNPGDVKIYNFLKNDLLNGDESTADQFMLSEQGGYTPGELKSIKFRAVYFQKKKNQSMISGSAF